MAMHSPRRTCRGTIAAAIFVTWASAASAGGQGVASVLQCPLEPGRNSFSTEVGGLERHVEVEVGPRAGKGGPAPVVFLWHGWGSDPRNLLATGRLAKFWPEAVVIAPRGLGRRFPGPVFRTLPGWQIVPGEFDDRDLRLFDAIVFELSKLGCLDADRFVSSGFSNGAYFSNLLGCERAAVLAAIAPVGGGGPPGDCEAPMPTWIAHGRADRVVPIREGRASFETWRERNACQEAENDSPGSKGCKSAVGCREETTLCTFKGGHWWPRELAPHWLRFLKGHRRSAPGQP